MGETFFFDEAALDDRLHPIDRFVGFFFDVAYLGAKVLPAPGAACRAVVRADGCAGFRELLKVKTVPFDGTTDGTDLSDQQDEIGPEIRLSFRATFAPLKSVLSGKSVVYSVFVFSLRRVNIE